MTRVRVRQLGKAIRHPGRAILRVVLQARVSRNDARMQRQQYLAFLSRWFKVDAWDLADEYRRSSFAREYAGRLTELRRYRGPYRMGTTGQAGCEALYVLVRAAKPQEVVETGVLYGGSSGHILAALARNESGRLHSIDLAGAPDEPPHDFLVPARLQHRWEFVEGDSRDHLPSLLARLGQVDLFHHDSLHTFEHMTWEYEAALPYLLPGGVLSSHDVLISHSLREIFGNNAFTAFCERHHPRCVTLGNLGIAHWREAEPREAQAEISRTEASRGLRRSGARSRPSEPMDGLRWGNVASAAPRPLS